MQILKMKTKNVFFRPAFIVILAATCITALSCNKTFDEPPVYTPPAVNTTMTIAALKTMHTFGNVEVITTDDVIEGTVVANDSSGNYFKQIIIQDSTGGIVVRMDGYDLYTSYPIGRKVYIKVNGLSLGDYNRLYQIGAYNSSTGEQTGIASQLFDSYLIKGDLNNFITPKTVTVSQLNDTYQSTLIRLENFEFAAADTNKTYADAVGKASVNFTLKSCAGESITLRNSGYADFASLSVPNGNGTVTAIYSVFGSTKQLNIRDTSDLQLYGPRCDGGSGGGWRRWCQ